MNVKRIIAAILAIWTVSASIRVQAVDYSINKDRLKPRYIIFSLKGGPPLLGTLIAAGDISGDSKSEIISDGITLKDDIFVYSWDMERTKEIWQSGRVGILHGIATYDIDDDRLSEIVIYSYIGAKDYVEERNSLVILKWDKGRFTSKSFFTPTMGTADVIEIGHFTDKKGVNLVVDEERYAHEETILDNLVFFKYEKDGFKMQPIKIELPCNAISMFVKDANGDGLDDIWVLGDNSQFQIYSYSKGKKAFILLRDLKLPIEDTLTDRMVKLRAHGKDHILFIRSEEVYELILPESDKEPVNMELLTKLPLNIVRSAVAGDIDGDGNQELLISASGKGAGFFIYEYLPQ